MAHTVLMVLALVLSACGGVAEPEEQPVVACHVHATSEEQCAPGVNARCSMVETDAGPACCCED